MPAVVVESTNFGYFQIRTKHKTIWPVYSRIRDWQFELFSDRIEITANTDELDLLAKKDIIIDSDEGDVLIEAADRIRLRPRNSVIDFVPIHGQKRDIANPDGDIMLPKFIKERAGDLRPMVEILKLELQALPYLILPPVLPGLPWGGLTGGVFPAPLSAPPEPPPW